MIQLPQQLADLFIKTSKKIRTLLDNNGEFTEISDTLLQEDLDIFEIICKDIPGLKKIS